MQLPGRGVANVSSFGYPASNPTSERSENGNSSYRQTLAVLKKYTITPMKILTNKINIYV
jgi:hypothetical protein